MYDIENHWPLRRQVSGIQQTIKLYNFKGLMITKLLIIFETHEFQTYQ